MADIMTYAQNHVYRSTFSGLFSMFHHAMLIMCSEKAMDMMMSILTDNGLAHAKNAASDSAVDTDDRATLSSQCLACGYPEQIIWVHGHGQCIHCHTNLVPCCDGAVCEDFS